MIRSTMVGDARKSNLFSLFLRAASAMTDIGTRAVKAGLSWISRFAPSCLTALEWFGYLESKKIGHQIVHHGDVNCMDSCVLCPETSVAVDFVFEPGLPVADVPDELWF
jgi:hypothetical protein